ncbi:energy transducer TonB [Arenimonas soli]|uniref:energy transducer TonB n=1 Tax=Arenimonas soli TaxID=2269504 RepID=UPI00166C8F24
MLLISLVLVALSSPAAPTAAEPGCAGIDQRLVHCPAPRAPRTLGLTAGKIVVRLSVLCDGSVGDAAILSSSGHRAWDRSAVAAVRSWQFRPSSEGFTKDVTLLLTVDGGPPPN